MKRSTASVSRACCAVVRQWKRDYFFFPARESICLLHY